MNLFELRWLITPSWDGPEKILQYRYRTETTDYSNTNIETGNYLTKIEWSSWITVPTVDET